MTAAAGYEGPGVRRPRDSLTRRRTTAGWHPAIVKIGGSLAGSRRLPHILEIVTAARRPLVIVPGGGRFADTVRAEQLRLGFSNRAAHRMAILAMHQMAYVLAGMEPRLAPAGSVSAMHRAAAAGRIPVWLPLRLATRDPLLPEAWSVTSDGLAAWLAERLGAPLTVLLKACTVDPAAAPEELAAAGIADPVFAGIVARSDLRWHVLGEDGETALRVLLAGGEE